MTDGARVLEAVEREPAGSALLSAAAGRPGVQLVGGAVRDHLLGRPPRELDVAVEGDALALARELCELLGGSLVAHERFGTATVDSPSARIDLAATRTESYAAPGALPEVELGASITEDLARRDFTVNAIALTLSAEGRGELHAVPGALDDLAAGRLRVLHDASFEDDPTRLLRLARYATRLGFEPEAHTGELARSAANAGALDTISGVRLGADLRPTLAEGALGWLERLGVLAALGHGLHPADELIERAAALAPGEAVPDRLGLAAALQGADALELSGWLDDLGFPSRDRDAVVAGATEPVRLVAALADTQRPSQIRAQLAGRPIEAVLLAGALGAERAVRRWLEELRGVELQIGGEDLIAAGVPPGAEIGRRLRAVLDGVLDGDIAPGRDSELRAALHEQTAG